MTDDFDMKIVTQQVDLNQSVIARDYSVAVMRLPEQNPVCGCGRDHSTESIISIELQDFNGKIYQVLIPAYVADGDNPLFTDILNGSFAEKARACLARLESTDVD